MYHKIFAICWPQFFIISQQRRPWQMEPSSLASPSMVIFFYLWHLTYSTSNKQKFIISESIWHVLFLIQMCHSACVWIISRILRKSQILFDKKENLNYSCYLSLWSLILHCNTCGSKLTILMFLMTSSLVSNSNVILTIINGKKRSVWFLV